MRWFKRRRGRRSALVVAVSQKRAAWELARGDKAVLEAMLRMSVPMYELANWAGHRDLGGWSFSKGSLSGVTLHFRAATGAYISVMTRVADVAFGEPTDDWLSEQLTDEELRTDLSSMLPPPRGLPGEGDHGAYWREYQRREERLHAAWSPLTLRVDGADVSFRSLAVDDVWVAAATVSGSQIHLAVSGATTADFSLQQASDPGPYIEQLLAKRARRGRTLRT